MIQIHARHPSGFTMTVEVETLADVDVMMTRLQDKGYRPTSQPQWPRTPEGLPMCPKHQAVMNKREKQGDEWYSHRLILPSGEERYCRGYSTGKPDDGFTY